MTEDHKPQTRLATTLASPAELSTVLDNSLKRGSSLTFALSDSTLGVNLDRLGDWTITVGLPSRSDRFHRITTALESLGFFEATENGGTTYMLWTSLLSETADLRLETEQMLLRVLNVLSEPPASPYIC